MTTRTSNALVLASTAALVVALCVWAFATRINDRSQQVSISSNLHMTVWSPGWRKWYRNLDRQFLVFNDVKNSPNRGLSALHSLDVWKPLPGISIWRSGPGVSAWVARTGPVQTKSRWFTVYVSLYYPIVLFAIAPATWLIRRYRHFKRAGRRGFPVVPSPAVG